MRITPWQRPAQGLEVTALKHFRGVVSHDEDGSTSPLPACPPGAVVQAAAGLVRHRRHRSPARSRVVKVRYDDREHSALAAAADRAGLTVAGFLAGAGLSVAGQGPPPSQAADRELLGELLRLRLAIRRYAVNVNQAVAALNSTGQAPVWLSRAVAGADRAVSSADEATRRVTGRAGRAG